MKEKTNTEGETTSKLGMNNSTKLIPFQNSSNSGLEMAPTKLFVGGLSWQTTADKLKDYFGQFGNITDVLLMKDPLTQRNRGFGFITFSSPDALDRVSAVPSHTLDGKKIDPKPATPKGKTKTLKTNKVFVGGVSQDCTEDEVKTYFSQFGNVREVVMLMDQQTRRHRGFGFISFESEEAVDTVCKIQFHVIKEKKVECKKAQSKEAALAVKTGAYAGNRLFQNVTALPPRGFPAAMQSMPGHVMRYLPGHAVQSMQYLPGQALLPLPGQARPGIFQGQALPASMQPSSGFTPFALGHYHHPQATLPHFQPTSGKLLNASVQPNYRYSPYPLPIMSPLMGSTPAPKAMRIQPMKSPIGIPPPPPSTIQFSQGSNSVTGAPPPPLTTAWSNQCSNSVTGAPPPLLKSTWSNQGNNSVTGMPPFPLPSAVTRSNQMNSPFGIPPPSPTAIQSSQMLNPSHPSQDQVITPGTGGAGGGQYSGYNLTTMSSLGNMAMDWSRIVYGAPQMPLLDLQAQHPI